MEKGTIFNIQRYSLHDGPGIRTTIFLKGCPLRCWWCHNPEGICFKQELIVHGNKCLGCGSCADVCAQGAISSDQLINSIDRKRCVLCFKCVEECPASAIETAGAVMTVGQIMSEVVKDKIFFDQSGGGVTLSGGEPLAQPLFLYALLKALKKEKIRTAVDTSGYTKWRDLKLVSALTDLFLYDLKIMNNNLSKKYTGRSNKMILENLSRLAQIHRNIQIRIPLIPGLNDDRENIDALGRYLYAQGLKQVSIHPYHRTGWAKYEKIGCTNKLPPVEVPTPQMSIRVGNWLRQYGLKIIFPGEVG